jgi:hypothetical protein
LISGCPGNRLRISTAETHSPLPVASTLKELKFKMNLLSSGPYNVNLEKKNYVCVANSQKTHNMLVSLILAVFVSFYFKYKSKNTEISYERDNFFWGKHYDRNHKCCAW